MPSAKACPECSRRDILLPFYTSVYGFLPFSLGLHFLAFSGFGEIPCEGFMKKTPNFDILIFLTFLLQI